MLGFFIGILILKIIDLINQAPLNQNFYLIAAAYFSIILVFLIHKIIRDRGIIK